MLESIQQLHPAAQVAMVVIFPICITAIVIVYTKALL